MILESGKVYKVVKVIEGSKPVILRVSGSVAFGYDTLAKVPNPATPADLYQDDTINDGFYSTEMLQMCDWVGYTGEGYCEIKNMQLVEKQ